jgi:bifunctional non-homologous end joining protein LigD
MEDEPRLPCVLQGDRLYFPPRKTLSARAPAIAQGVGLVTTADVDMGSVTHARRRALPKRAEALPHIDPMLALASDLPASGKEWAYEFKWDGMRAICRCADATVRLSSRAGNDVTNQYPELQALGKALRRQRVVLDGEIIALDEYDRPSFPNLQHRMHVVKPTDALVAARPVVYVVFDLLYLNEESLLDEPFSKRRERLGKLKIDGPHWRLSPSYDDAGEPMLQTARETGLEGVVAKRLDSIYEPGRRQGSWLKIKVVLGQELVIGGWIPQEGSGGKRVGSLLMGYYDADHKLQFAGAIGTGFDAEAHAMLSAKLSRLQRAGNPFAEKLPKKEAIFVRPTLVAEIEYRRWPAGGSIHQGAYKGLRTDKQADTVVKERPNPRGGK